MTELDPKKLRRAFGAYMTGVTVVTTLTSSGARVGFTANSFASVSLDPPLLSVCPGKFLSSFAHFRDCGRFAVSVLAEGQEDVSNIFAGGEGDRFAKVAWRPDATGTPLIEGAAAQFSCVKERAIEAGDHVILLGRVEAARTTGARGLGYAQGRYFSLGLERASPRGGPAAIAGAIVEHRGAILLEDDERGLRPPEIALDKKGDARRALGDLFAQRGLDVTLDVAYALYDDRPSGDQRLYFLARAKGPETGGRGAYHSIDDLGRLAIDDAACASMLERYAQERRRGAFGLYIGDDEAGAVERLQERN